MKNNTSIKVLLSEKYRPVTVEECILPDNIKANFKEFIKSGSFPHLLLTGTQGTGKTTVAKALLNELDYDYIMINASDERNLDTIRGRIRGFASQVSLENKPKAIILDEADGLAPIAQGALRAVMEEYSRVKFILTCNFKSKLIEPIHSRTSVISFNIKQSEKKACAVRFIKRIIEICEKEKIKYDTKAIAAIVQKYYPDGRRIINEVQRYSGMNGILDSTAIDVYNKQTSDELLKCIKKKDIDGCRKWVVNNLDYDAADLFKDIYENLYTELKEESIPEAIMLIAEYQYKSAFVANHEINFMAFIVQVIGSCEFKNNG